jgi:hypothetical protein
MVFQPCHSSSISVQLFAQVSEIWRLPSSLIKPCESLFFEDATSTSALSTFCVLIAHIRQIHNVIHAVNGHNVL